MNPEKAPLHPAFRWALLVLVLGLMLLFVAAVVSPVAREQEQRARNEVTARAANSATMNGPFEMAGGPAISYYRLGDGKWLFRLPLRSPERSMEVLVRFDQAARPEAVFGLDTPLYGLMESVFADSRIPEHYEVWMGPGAKDLYQKLPLLSQAIRSGLEADS